MATFVIATGIIAILIFLVIMSIYGIARQRREEAVAMMRDRLKYIDSFRFPAGMNEKIAKRRPELTYSQIDQVLEALRDYFRVCLMAHAPGGKAVGMPSRVVDDAWHEFILFTRDYHIFCEGAFGRFLHHAPHGKATSTIQIQDQLGRTWNYANRSPSRNNANTDAGLVAAGGVPLLFAIDQMLGIPDGQHYSEEDVQEFESQRKKHAEVSSADAGFLWMGGAADDEPNRPHGNDVSDQIANGGDDNPGGDTASGDAGGGDAGGCGGGGSGCGGGGCGGGGCGAS